MDAHGLIAMQIEALPRNVKVQRIPFYRRLGPAYLHISQNQQAGPGTDKKQECKRLKNIAFICCKKVWSLSILLQSEISILQ